MLYTSSLSLGSQAYIDFPVKALWVKTAIGVGQRSEKNDGNEQDLSSVVGEFSGEIVGYFPLYHEHLVFKASLQGQWLTHIMQNASSSGFFENELYRIGGFGSLRGFNQESIITSAYAISKVELQLRIDRAINTFLFYDQGILSGYGIPNLAVQMPYGVGFGFQLASMGSLFSMSYALGNGMGEHLSFKNAKLHLGVTAKF
jgi:hemolysin activation/secretion protein